TKTDADVSERYARVRQRQPADAGADDVLAKAEDQSVGAVAMEGCRVFVDDFQEALHLACSDGLDELEVWLQSAFELGLAEDGSIWNVAYEKLDDGEKFHRCLVEADGNGAGWGLSGCTDKMLVGLGVRQLDGTNSSKVIHVSCHLVVRSCLGEVSLSNKSV